MIELLGKEGEEAASVGSTNVPMSVGSPDSDTPKSRVEVGKLWLSDGSKIVDPSRTSGVDVSMLDESMRVVPVAKARFSLEVAMLL